MRTSRSLSLFGALVVVGAIAGAANAAPTANRQLWDRVFESGNATAEAVSPDGSSVYVTGCSGVIGCAGKMQTVAYSVATGHELWSAKFTGTKQSTSLAIEVSPDGTKVFITGNARYFYTEWEYQTNAYDAATGVELWEARYALPSGGAGGCCIQVSPDNSTVFVTGSSSTSQTGSDFTTIAYDASTGGQEWVTRYNGPLAHGTDSPTALRVSSDGRRLFVTGESPGQDLYNDYATVAYDAATGTQLWVSRYNNPSEIGDTAYDLAVSPDGSRVFVTGCQGDFDYCVNSDYLTIAYDAATGTQLWLSTYQAPGKAAVAKSIGVSPDGSLVFVTGYASNASTAAYVTIAYDTGTGSQVWLKSFSGGSNPPAYACCLAVSGDGSRLIVTGTSGDAYASLQTYTTIAYDPASGSQLWSANFAGSGTYSIPSAVAVTKNGQVAIVTGTILGPDGQYDWGTVAFRS